MLAFRRNTIKTQAKRRIVLILLFFTACANAKTTETPAAEKPWLQSLTCVFPCWQGITPQETKFDDAMSSLGKANPPIDFTGTTQDEIAFQSQNTVTGSIHRASNSKVDSIILNVPYEKITLGDLEEIAGQPDQVHIGRVLYETEECAVVVFFPKEGLLLDLFPLRNQAGPFDKVTDCRTDIDPDSQILRIVLIGSLGNSDLWKTAYSKLSYVKWKGYGQYP